MYILTSKFIKNFHRKTNKAVLHIKKHNYIFIETANDVYLLRDKLHQEFMQINLDTSLVIHIGYEYLLDYLLEKEYIIILKDKI